MKRKSRTGIAAPPFRRIAGSTGVEHDYRDAGGVSMFAPGNGMLSISIRTVAFSTAGIVIPFINSGMPVIRGCLGAAVQIEAVPVRLISACGHE
jgi:hypothetical protein